MREKSGSDWEYLLQNHAILNPRPASGNHSPVILEKNDSKFSGPNITNTSFVIVFISQAVLEINEMIYAKTSADCSAHGNCSVHVSSYCNDQV